MYEGATADQSAEEASQRVSEVAPRVSKEGEARPRTETGQRGCSWRGSWRATENVTKTAHKKPELRASSLMTSAQLRATERPTKATATLSHSRPPDPLVIIVVVHGASVPGLRHIRDGPRRS